MTVVGDIYKASYVQSFLKYLKQAIFSLHWRDIISDIMNAVKSLYKNKITLYMEKLTFEFRNKCGKLFC